MVLRNRLLFAWMFSACASTPAPLPSLHATQGPAGKPCSSCSSDERCGEHGACVPTRLHAVPFPASSQAPRFDAEVAAREQARVAARHRIRTSRISLVVGSGILVTGTAILAATLAAGAPRSPYDDGNDGFEFLWGAIPMAFGALTMLVSGPILINSRNRLRDLAEPRRPLLYIRPSVLARPRGGEAGFVIDLRF